MLWIKAFHIIFVICWFAGIFYLPRLFVNAAIAEHEQTRHQLIIMQRKLYRFMSGLAVLAVVFGLIALSINWSYFMSQAWMHAKLALVLLLIIYHFACGHFVRKFENNEEDHNHIFFRYFNEAPVLILFVIVILVVVRPF